MAGDTIESERMAWASVAALGLRIAALADAILEGDGRRSAESRLRLIAEYGRTVQETAAAMGRQVARGVHANPPLAVFLNPPAGRGALMSRKVVAIRYQHAEDGKYYQHDFTTPVSMRALSDGSLRIASLDGKSLHDDF